MEASSLWPSSGNPHHQLAILASYSGDELVTVYRYFRSLAVDNPFSTARENLTIAFEKLWKHLKKFTPWLKAIFLELLSSGPEEEHNFGSGKLKISPMQKSYNVQFYFRIYLLLSLSLWVAFLRVGNEVEEKQATARTFFWNHCISFLNNLLSSGLRPVMRIRNEICFFNMSNRSHIIPGGEEEDEEIVFKPSAADKFVDVIAPKVTSHEAFGTGVDARKVDLGSPIASVSAPYDALISLISNFEKNPVSRPVRHSGPPPGFSPVPPKNVEEPFSGLNLKNENLVVDDYSWLDGYQLAILNTRHWFLLSSANGKPEKLAELPLSRESAAATSERKSTVYCTTRAAPRTVSMGRPILCVRLYWCEHPVAWCNQVQPPLCSPASLACAELSRLVNGDYGRKGWEMGNA
ncbi:Protein SMG7 [Vitis vinifera]|uniref:Protein SMG7 n=1 Tax=Vitis vinifera TaxID=29760 RepID=A0A438I646_VITVI|nr:Protein SMG7 [Vitis vinifera]